MPRFWPILLAFAAACGSDAPTKDDTSVGMITDPTTPDACAATITSIAPAEGAEVPADTLVTATFSEAVTADDPFDLVVLDASGAAVPGAVALASDGLSATFTPDAPLAHEAAWDVEATVCDDGATSAFTTVPEPVDAALLSGRTYGVRYEDVTWVEPGNASVLPLDLAYVLVQVEGVDVGAGTIDAVASTAADDDGTVVPDCPAAVQAPTSDFTGNPLLQVGPTDLQFPYNGGTFTIEAFELQGRFTADAAQIADIRISGLVDPAQLIPNAECGDVVTLLAGTCLPCASTPNDCLVIEATAPSADWIPSVDVIGECGL